MPLDDSTLKRLRGDGDRKQSLPASLAFGDRDLKTPQHDEILLWLDAKLPELVIELTGGPRTWDLDDLASQEAYALEMIARGCRLLQAATHQPDSTTASSGNREAARAACAEIERLKLPTRPRADHPNLTVAESIWEFALMGQRGFVAGFVDLLARTQDPVVLLSYPNIETEAYRGYVRCPSDSKDEYARSLYVGGFDKQPRWHVMNRTGPTFAFEIKSTIPSLGELIRQLRFYEAQLDADTNLVVVSPDERWNTAIASQGFAFIAYPSGEITK